MSSLRRDETVCCHSEDYRSVQRRGGGGGEESGERRGEEVEREMRTMGEEGRGSRERDEDDGRGGERK